MSCLQRSSVSPVSNRFLFLPYMLSFFFSFALFFCSTLKEQLPVLSTGSRASTPLKKEADSIRAKLEELGEDAAEVSTR